MTTPSANAGANEPDGSSASTIDATSSVSTPAAPIQITRPAASTIEDSKFIAARLPLTQNVISASITVTEDKVRLALHSHLDRLSARGAWIAPLGVLLSALAALAAADFKDALLSAATWQAVFVLVSLASAAWLTVAIMRRIRLGREDPVQNIMDELRGR
jgi:hypothetical protein